MYTLRRRNALFCVPFFLLFAAGAVYGRIVQVLQSPWRRPIIRAAGLENRMEKRLKSDLEPLNLTSQGLNITSSSTIAASSDHIITSARMSRTSFLFEGAQQQSGIAFTQPVRCTCAFPRNTLRKSRRGSIIKVKNAYSARFFLRGQ